MTFASRTVVSATVAADQDLRSQRRHGIVSQVLALRSAFRGPAAIAELDR